MTVKQGFLVVGLELEPADKIHSQRDMVLLKLLPTEVEVTSGYYITGPDTPITEQREKILAESSGEILCYRMPSTLFEKLGKPTIGDTVIISVTVPSVPSPVVSVGET